MKKLIVTICILFSLIIIAIINTNAMNATFPTYSHNDDKVASDFYESLNIKIITQEPTIYDYVSELAVRDDGGFAVLTYKTPDPKIYVYSSEGKFEYGFETTCRCSFEIEFDGNNLLLVDYSTMEIISVDSNGNFIESACIDADANLYDKSLEINSNEYSRNGYVYTLDSDGWISDIFIFKEKVIKTDTDGNETVLYDCSDNNTGLGLFEVGNSEEAPGGFYVIAVPLVIIGTGVIALITFLQIRKYVRKIKKREMTDE